MFTHLCIHIALKVWLLPDLWDSLYWDVCIYNKLCVWRVHIIYCVVGVGRNSWIIDLPHGKYSIDTC